MQTLYNVDPRQQQLHLRLSRAQMTSTLYRANPLIYELTLSRQNFYLETQDPRSLINESWLKVIKATEIDLYIIAMKASYANRSITVYYSFVFIRRQF